ncbi:SPOR domain-containing protein [Gordonia sp. (in: high G+C Gram-positive bacteria)]|uniref:SPOR domain-containing protein n=1 Tax=Gordonia sp. (in: high G+C Gram-positive bacteria) TaxID=84139 RepID=UPI003C75B86A
MNDFDRGHVDRHSTLHGEPLPLSSYPPPPRPPGKPANWLVVAISAISVVVVGVAGMLLWLLKTNAGGEPEPAAAQQPVVTSIVNATPVPTATAHATAPTSLPATAATPPVQSPSSPWYAQFGAYNNYDNAQAEVSLHDGAVILPGSRVGSTSAYVVVRPTASEAEAQRVCAKFAEGSCYVRSGQ